MNKGTIYYSLNRKLDSSTILQRIARGESTAVDECLETYGKIVWSIALKCTNTREDAEDLVQEIFIDIWKNAAQFDASKSPESMFVRLIAKRRLIDTLRRSYRRPAISFEENALDLQASDAHNRLQTSIETKCIIKALNKLSRQEMQAIKMSIYKGMSHSEIAGIIGLPVGTVKTHIRRGIKKVRKSMGLATTLQEAAV
jgi:RNA polymerase sigma-70 factor (ECF subfamily)